MEIKSCPFCGSPGFVLHLYEVDSNDYEVEYSFVSCSNFNCCARGPCVDSYEDANKAELDEKAICLWNNRF